MVTTSGGIADEEEGNVLGRIIDPVKLVGLGFGDCRDVGGPADDRPTIRRGFPNHGVQLFGEFAQRSRFSAPPAFFEDDVALSVKLAEDRMENSVGFHPHPKFEFIRWDVDKVSSEVFGGERVHLRTTVSGVDAIEFVFDQNFALLGNQLIEFLFELFIAPALIFGFEKIVDFAEAIFGAHFLFFFAHLIAKLFLRGYDFEVLLIVFGANGRRAFEHHVFKKVGDASDAGAFIRAADMGNPTASEGGFVVALDHKQAHAIGELFLDYGDLLAVHGQCGTNRIKKNQKAFISKSCEVFHNPTSISVFPESVLTLLQGWSITNKFRCGTRV